MSARPSLRPFIDALPVQVEGPEGPLELFALKDPFRISEGLLVSMAGLALVSLLDGSRTPAEVQAEFGRRYGAAPELAQVEELVASLEQNGLLVGPRFAALIDEFSRTSTRAPACIGSYPGQPSELKTFLEAQYARDGGPGSGPRADVNGSRPIRGVVSPHIDMHRGGHSYAWAWRAVAESCPAEVFVIFGTSHTGTAPIDEPFAASSPIYALTRKTFQTPLGDLPADGEVIDRLVRAYDGPGDLFAGEFHHRGEHSIEFQAVYLAHLFAGRRPIRIVPVLCGSIAHLPEQPLADPRFASFHAALREALGPLPPEKVAFVAGIDLAHVGRQFQEPPVSEADLERVAAQDRETMRIATQERCPATVHVDIARDGDPRNICGHAPLVAMLEALREDPVSGELLHYDRWYDGASSVSFASAVYRWEGSEGAAS